MENQPKKLLEVNFFFILESHSWVYGGVMFEFDLFLHHILVVGSWFGILFLCILFA